jgi:hypothetical protein
MIQITASIYRFTSLSIPVFLLSAPFTALAFVVLYHSCLVLLSVPKCWISKVRPGSCSPTAMIDNNVADRSHGLQCPNRFPELTFAPVIVI